MGKKWVLISSLIVLILLFLGYIASQMVHVTGPVIWIDRSLAGGWKTDEIMGGWWDSLSRLNPLLSEESKRVVVYLLPTLQTSQIAVGCKVSQVKYTHEHLATFIHFPILWRVEYGCGRSDS